MKQLIWFFLLAPVFVNAQINESDTLDIKAGLDVSAFLQGGNVQTVIFRAKQDFSVKAGEKMVYKTQNSYVYQEFGKSKADEDILSLNFLYFNPEKRIYPFLLGFGSTNFRREIDLRYLMGGGVSFNALERDKDWLKFSLSSEYEKTEFASTNFNIDEYDGLSEMDTFRGTLWTKGRYHFFDKKLIMNHENYVQPSLERSNNFRWQADFGLEFPIWEFLSLKTNYLQTHESIVIEGQEKEDRFFTFGFNVKTY